jgi:hypothetical protein
MTDWARDLLNGLGATFLMAAIGRLAWHVRAVQMGKRRFFSLHLLWESPTALAMGIVGDGAADYLDLTGKIHLAVIVTLAYLGPRGVESLIGVYVRRMGDGK